MITINEKTFALSTRETTLLLRVNEIGKVVCDHYGRRLEHDDLALAAVPDGVTTGRTIVYDEKQSEKLALPSIHGEYSTPFKGDDYSPSLEIVSDKGRLYDFVFVSALSRPLEKMEGYPTPHGEAEELILLCRDEKMGAELELHYAVFEDCDVIGKFVLVRNVGEKPFTLRRVYSSQFCLEDQGYVLHASYGSWAGEFQRAETPIGHFRYELGSDSGSSSDQHNPFFMVRRDDASLRTGAVYGFNLIYSGSHRIVVEKDAFGLIRIQQGISPRGLEKTLAPGDTFLTPMAVLTYTHNGLNGISKHMHAFVNDHVIPTRFARVPRPIAFNNWEGTYMKFNEAKLHSLAKKAKDLGCELFVLDDGWFGHRDADNSSLGDWDVYKKKLPHGIEGISKYVRKLGLKFGLWFEPEMASPDSHLLEQHPDWVIQDGIHEPSLGRHQLVLDLTKKEVRDYLFDALSNHLSTGCIDFVKWDYNRTICDIPNSGSFLHDYILGLYDLVGRLTKAFPDVLFENCASGGARNDLGMFSYFPQGWVSDDTDSFERAKMQLEMSFGYPQSVMSNHVSAKTNHQMLRKTGFGTKFDVAAIGVLGYEMDISELDSIEEKAIKSQIEFYKKHRETLQFGIYRILDTFEHGHGRLIVEVADANKALVTYVNYVQTPHPGNETLPMAGLDPEATYAYSVRPEYHSLKTFGSLINQVSPVHIKEEGVLVNVLSRFRGLDAEGLKGEAKGCTLNAGALQIGRQWAGTGYDDSTRILLDFGARIYVFEKK
ncbi:MAG: alpha-galactosidase [Bacilli bacterium]|nr:alpha-galactosidase [Bacilli bacterium]